MKIIKKVSRGFTLIELLIAMTLTVVIVGVLIGMTRLSMDAFKESSSKAKASQLAKESLDVMARDLEGAVIRSGNSDQWLYAKIDSNLAGDLLSPTTTTGAQNTSAALQNPLEIGFFTAATDRYNGGVGTNRDEGGDVSAVFYRLVCKNILDGGLPVYSLYRYRVNPKEAFAQHISQGEPSDESIEGTVYKVHKGFEESSPGIANITKSDYFLAENIYNLNMTFVFEYVDAQTGATKIVKVPVKKDAGSGSSSPDRLSLQGDLVLLNNGQLLKEGVLNGAPIANTAQLVAVELGALVINNSAMDLLQNKRFKNADAFNEFLKENSHYFTKTVKLSSL